MTNKGALGYLLRYKLWCIGRKLRSLALLRVRLVVYRAPQPRKKEDAGDYGKAMSRYLRSSELTPPLEVLKSQVKPPAPCLIYSGSTAGVPENKELTAYIEKHKVKPELHIVALEEI